MKLQQIFESKGKPVLAWLRPAAGPKGVKGVELVYLQPMSAEIDHKIGQAKKYADKNSKKHADRMKELAREKDQYTKEGKKYFIQSLGWWMNEDDFHAGRESADGANKGDMMYRYPNFQVVKNEEAAIKKAKDTGLI